MPKKNISAQVSIFKNKPLVRCGNTLYYGNVSDKYIITLSIVSEQTLFDNIIADDVKVQLLSTDSELSSRQRILKQCKRNGLYAAFDVADTWLSKALLENFE